MIAESIAMRNFQPAPWSKDLLGDRRGLAQRKNVPFSIIIDRQPFVGELPGLFDSDLVRKTIATWDGYSPAQQMKIITKLFARANEVLKHMSGGRFSLKLGEINYTREIDFDCSFDNGGFTLHIKHVMSDPVSAFGYYSYDKGHFYVIPLALFTSDVRTLSAGTMVHEIMHGFLGAHSYDQGGICDVSRPEIGLSQREAEYLGWPQAHPVRILLDNPLKAVPSPL